MAEGFNVNFPNCVPPRLRKELDKVAKNNNSIVAPLAVIIDDNDGDPVTAIPVQYLVFRDGDTFPTSVVRGLSIRGTLAGALIRDGNATLNLVGGGTQVIGGYFVKTGYYIAASQRVGARLYHDGTFQADVTDDCLTYGSPP